MCVKITNYNWNRTTDHFGQKPVWTTHRWHHRYQTSRNRQYFSWSFFTHPGDNNNAQFFKRAAYHCQNCHHRTFPPFSTATRLNFKETNVKYFLPQQNEEWLEFSPRFVRFSSCSFSYGGENYLFKTCKDNERDGWMEEGGIRSGFMLRRGRRWWEGGGRRANELQLTICSHAVPDPTEQGSVLEAEHL